MGIRSAFNPLGALPYTVAVSDNGYTITWTVDNIPKVGNDYVLPSSWFIGGTTVSSSSLSVSYAADTNPNHSGCYVATLTYQVATGTAPGSVSVALNDSDFVANS